jgi:hypothetical protein
VDDAQLSAGLRTLVPAKIARQYLQRWPVIRDGDDLPEPIVVELWQEWRGGLVLLSQANRRWGHHVAGAPASFAEDAEGFEGLRKTPLPKGLPPDTLLLALWSEDGGARLAPDAHPDPAACQYLGLPYPAHWLSTRAAGEALGLSQSHIARLVRTGVIPSRRCGSAHEVDPLYVAWRA